MSNISQSAIFESTDYLNRYTKHSFVEYKPQKRTIKFKDLSNFINKYYLDFPYIQFVLKENISGEQILFATASENPINIKALESHYVQASPLPLPNVNSASKVCLNMDVMGRIEECINHFWNSMFNTDITSGIRTNIRAYLDRNPTFYGKDVHFYNYMGDHAVSAPYYFSNWQENGFPYEILLAKVNIDVVPKGVTIVDESAKIFFNMSSYERNETLKPLNIKATNENVVRMFGNNKNVFYRAIEEYAKHN
jgi:hypothetical protein